MEKLLTVEDVAEILAVDKISVYGMVFKKRIPCLKISGRLLRFKESEIAEWLQNKAQSTGEGILPNTKSSKRSPASSRGIGANDEVRRIIELAKKNILKD